MSSGKIMPGISPSLMCGNSLRQNEFIRELNQLEISWYHIDVMDGHFVPNLGLNLNFIRDLRDATEKRIEVHLMCSTPLDWIEKVLNLGADAVSFHLEATHTPVRCLNLIKENGGFAGVALCPGTPLENLNDLSDYLDYVTLMGVEPGFEGQKFLPQTIRKTESTRNWAIEHQPELIIQIDGGVDISIGRKLLERGSDILVGGIPTLFQNDSIRENHEAMFSLFTTR